MRTIDKIRELLKMSVARKFYAEARLDDGRLVVTEADAMAIGVEVFVMNEEGQAEPLVDGEYTLEDGTKLLIAEGRVGQLGEEVAAEAQEEEMGDNYGDMRKKLSEIGLADDLIEKVVEVVTEMYPKEGAVEEMNEAITEMAQTVAGQMRTLMSRVEALENKPGAPGVKHSPAVKSSAPKAMQFSQPWETALHQITIQKNL